VAPFGLAAQPEKDRKQAEALILALAERQPGALALARRAATAHHDRGFLRDVRASLARLRSEAREALGLT